MDQKPVKSQRFWLIGLMGFFLIGYLPDILIALATPEELVFSGGLINTDDLSVYLSALRQGASGAWLFTPQFSPEPIPAHFAYLPFLLTGKIMNFFGGSPLLWFQLLRGAAIISAAFALKSLVITIFPNQTRTQRTAWLLLLFGSGTGWLVSVLSNPFSPITPDLYTPEWNLLTASYSSPHFVLGIAGQAWFFAAVIKGLDQPSWKQLAAGVLAASLLGAAYPFLAVVNGLALAIYFLILILRDRRIPWQAFGITLAQSLPLVACLWYYGLALPQDAAWAEAMLGNNRIPPPPPLGILVGGGLLLLLALVGLLVKTGSSNHGKLLLYCWLGGNLAAVYLPFSFSGRLVLGLFIPMAILAAAGLEALLENLKPAQAKNSDAIRRMLIWLTLPSTILLFIWSLQTGFSRLEIPYFYPSALAEAAEFLARQTTQDDVVLAGYGFANYLPRVSPARVFAGHLNLTVDLDGKLADLETFWRPETPPDWREAFLHKWGITYVVQTGEEVGLLGDPIMLSGTAIYQEEGITIYQVDD